MKKTLLGATLIATGAWLTLALPVSEAAADDAMRENRAIDANVSRVHLGGTVHLVVHQGAAAALVLTGERDDLAKVTTVQRGDTLTIDQRETHHFGHHPELRADLTVPNLQEFVSTGVGATEISGFTGNRITLSQAGAGALQFNGQYRDVDATLAGVGSVTLNPGKTEQIALHMGGAGQITVAGQTKALRAQLSGVGSLDAQKLQADTVDLSMGGLGGATVYAKTAASINMSGMGSATVYGNPATRNATTSGLGKVTWQ